MTTYEKLRSRIVELVPEIVELKFGCRLKSLDSEAVFITSENQYQTRSFLHSGHNICYQFQKSEFEKEYEIIGRPITLEDILRAIGRRSDTWHVAGDGAFCCLNQVTGQFERVAQWHLGKPLEQQDEETLLFIAKILEI